MKVASINSCNYGSTGNIMLNISKSAREEGIETIVFCPRSRSNNRRRSEYQKFIGNRFTRNLHIVLAKYTGYHGCFSVLATLKLVNDLKKFNPNIIHLHNLHGDYVNIKILFDFIKKNKTPVIWTLHDCWAFTGQCPHFTMAKCEKWKNGCYDCPQYTRYPVSKIDRTKTMWKLKKKWFTNVQNLTIVTPSKWLARLVKESFLGMYPIKTINNGINLHIFKPVQSDFRKEYNIGKKQYMLLGVANPWGIRKGIDVFIELQKRLDKSMYKIVLVGTTAEIDMKLPKEIISIHNTQDQKELAKIYSAADLFINPTREEVLGLVNIEANACGIPVVTFNSGGSPECIDVTSGAVVECDDIDEMEHKIIEICRDKPYLKSACVERANKFDMEKKFFEYITLYRKLDSLDNN